MLQEAVYLWNLQVLSPTAWIERYPKTSLCTPCNTVSYPSMCDRRGVVLGDSWVSPVDFVQAWLPYLQALSLLDGGAYADMQNIVDAIKVGRNAF